MRSAIGTRGVGATRTARWAVAGWTNAAVKIGLVVAFVIAIAFPPDAVEGKGMVARAPLFVGPAIVVPILARVRGWRPYPHLADAMLSMPFLLDTLGNLLGFYDRYETTDDVLHFVNWVFLVLAFHAFRYRNVRDNRDAVFLGIGFGAVMIIVWELFEWAISDAGPFAGNVQDALNLSYGDTIGDLVISSTGGAVGSIIARLTLGSGFGQERLQLDPHQSVGRKSLRKHPQM